MPVVCVCSKHSHTCTAIANSLNGLLLLPTCESSYLQWRFGIEIHRNDSVSTWKSSIWLMAADYETDWCLVCASMNLVAIRICKRLNKSIPVYWCFAIRFWRWVRMVLLYLKAWLSLWGLYIVVTNFLTSRRAHMAAIILLVNCINFSVREYVNNS